MMITTSCLLDPVLDNGIIDENKWCLLSMDPYHTQNMIHVASFQASDGHFQFLDPVLDSGIIDKYDNGDFHTLNS